MPTPPNPANLLLGRGKIYLDRYSASGVRTGLRLIGNADTFELTTSDTKKEQYEHMTHATALYQQVTVQRVVTLKIKGDEFSEDNLALALMGDVVEMVQDATPIVAEPLTTNATPGLIYRTALLGPISAVAVKKGSTSLTLHTDYEILDPNIGLIQLVEGGPGYVAGDALTVNYTPTAYVTGAAPKKVVGGTETDLEVAVLFVPDPTTGPKMMVEVWRATVEPDTAIGLIADDFATWGLTLTLEDDSANHPSEPLYGFVYLPAFS